jgi:hypothetical protein
MGIRFRVRFRVRMRVWVIDGVRIWFKVWVH